MTYRPIVVAAKTHLRMQPQDFTNPAYCFERAEQARRQADTMCNPTARGLMLRAAEMFQALGDWGMRDTAEARQPESE